MTRTEQLKCLFLGPVPRDIGFDESRGIVRLTVCGRKNEHVAIRLLDSSGEALQLFDGDCFISPVEFRIPRDHASLEIDISKPSNEKYTFEVTTPAGITYLESVAA